MEKLSERQVGEISEAGNRYPEEESKLVKGNQSEIPGSWSPSPHCSTEPKLSKVETVPIPTFAVSHGMTGRPRVNLGARLCKIINSLGLGFFHPIPGAICC